MNKSRAKYRKENKDNIAQVCKKYKLYHPWLETLSNIQQRCENPKCRSYKWYGGRGIKCFITSKELKQLWFRDKGYLMNYPSIDRKDNNRNYEYKNCRFIEMQFNRIKDCIKSVLQFDLNGKFIKQWNSVSQVGLQMNIHKTGISACCRGIQKTCNIIFILFSIFCSGFIHI